MPSTLRTTWSSKCLSLLRRRPHVRLLTWPALCLAIAGCVSSLNPDLPLGELPAAVTSKVNLLASVSDPTSVLPVDPLQPGDTVELVGADPTGTWLLVFDGQWLGWMPKSGADAGHDSIQPAVVIEPLDGACTQYLGATNDPGQGWVSNTTEPVVVEGSLYRPHAGPDFVDASLTVTVDGDGEAIAADYMNIPLTTDASLVLFAYALTDLTPESKLSFLLDDPSREPLTFQATFYSNRCGVAQTIDNRFAAELPVGETRLEIPVLPPTPTPGRPASATPIHPQNPAPTPTNRPSPTAAREASRGEIERLADEWDRIHHDTDHTLDGSELDRVLTGSALRQQQKTLQSLRSYNCYWDFSDLDPSEIIGWREVSANEVIVTMRKHWDGKLYCNGKQDTKSSFDEPFDVRYQFIKTAQGWRIAEKLPLDE